MLPPSSDDSPKRSPGDPIGQLGPQDWLVWPETMAVMAALTAQGQDARFVGGCVRDALAHRPVSDIDIATPDRPERVMEILAAAGIRALPTGLAHGTVTALVGRKSFEITTLRTDEETFGRRARVAFTDDWLQDASRRDFTINAMSCRADGTVFDPFDGITDLAAGRVLFVGDAGQRIDEDRLRMLRYFRFFAYFGHPPVDDLVLAACRARAAGLLELSGERIKAEMMKLLAAPDPASTLLLMQSAGLLPVLFAPPADFGRLRQIAFLESRGVIRPSVTPDPLRRLAAFLSPAAAEDACSRLRLSNMERTRLLGMLEGPDDPSPVEDDVNQRRRLHRLGAERFRDRTLLGWAGRRAGGDRLPAAESARWLHLLDLADGWTPKTLPLAGRDLIAEGLVAAGPATGAMLARLEQWWEESDFIPDRDALLAKAREWSDHL